MTKPWIRYTCSRDVGCEITADEFDAYLDLVAQALVAAFPGADVEVNATDLSNGASKASADNDDNEEEIDRIVQDVWEAGEFWIDPAATVSDPDALHELARNPPHPEDDRAHLDALARGSKQ